MKLVQRGTINGRGIFGFPAIRIAFLGTWFRSPLKYQWRISSWWKVRNWEDVTFIPNGGEK